MWPTDGAVPFTDADVNALHAEGFGHPVLDIDWKDQVERHSLGWVCAYEGERLVGFVNVAWDGGVDAFVVDTLVDADARRRGIGTGLVEAARAEARAAGLRNGSTSTSRRSCAASTSRRAGLLRPRPAVIALRELEAE